MQPEDLSNPKNYKILIQTKGNRRLKYKTKYLNNNYDFNEDINEAKVFRDMQSAEQFLQMNPGLRTKEARPRIIVKYIYPN